MGVGAKGGPLLWPELGLRESIPKKVSPQLRPEIGEGMKPKDGGPGHRERSMQLAGRLLERSAGQASALEEVLETSCLFYFLSMKLTLRSHQQSVGP